MHINAINQRPYLFYTLKMCIYVLYYVYIKYSFVY